MKKFQFLADYLGDALSILCAERAALKSITVTFNDPEPPLIEFVTDAATAVKLAHPIFGPDVTAEEIETWVKGAENA